MLSTSEIQVSPCAYYGVPELPVVPAVLLVRVTPICDTGTLRYRVLLPHMMSLSTRWNGERELMLACVLAGPTVEQQGEMARSGGRMLATLEPEQVITLTDGFVNRF